MSESKTPSSASLKETPRSLVDFSSMPDEAYVRVATVARLLDCSEVTIWRKSREGSLPAPRKLSSRVTGWQVGAVRKYLQDREV